MQHHVFLSYSRKDTDIMHRVRDDLRNAGLIVWTDESLNPGTPSWKDSIERAIENTGCLAVILSPDAKQSEWVKKELDYAAVQEIRIFPILAKGDARLSIPFSLISFHYADIRDEYGAAMRGLVSAINELLGRFPTFQQEVEISEKAVLNPIARNSISVVIVDDIPETRTTIKRMLAFETDFEVIGEAGSGREAITEVKRLQPYIVLMDINMPDMDGIQATAQILKAYPNLAVIMISVQNDTDYIRRAMLAGARAFLAKPIDADELYTTIRQVHKTNRLRLE